MARWLVFSGLAAAGYFLFMRPRHLRWGATDAESKDYLPGDECIADGFNAATHAITIDAPVEDVWPWLLQVGRDKSGFYSYTFLENLVGCDIKDEHVIHPEWQNLKVGDSVKFHPSVPPQPVVALEPLKYLVLGVPEDAEEPWTWAFIVRDLGNGKTRLVIRIRSLHQGGLKLVRDLAVVEPAHFIMERKMMLTIKALAEKRARSLRAA
ncbi:MAG: hypothetical protein JSS65_06255 [Armatimonadetes bacterium]|nr:hypothetical protein [Armatimonadota bacterium]